MLSHKSLCINDGIKGSSLQFCFEVFNLVSIASDMLNLIPPVGLGVPAREDGDFVTGIKQFSYGEAAHEPCAANHQYVPSASTY